MRRPLVIVAIWYACGLLLADIVQPSLHILLALGFILATFAFLIERARHWLLCTLVIVVGWANLTLHTTVLSPHDLRNLIDPVPAEVVVRGTLMETPSVRMFLRDEEESFRTLAFINVSEVCRGTHWMPALGRVLAVTPGYLDGAGYTGTPVEINGVIMTPPGPVAPGLFDYRSYLARQGVFHVLKASSTNEWRASGLVHPPLADRFLTWARKALARGLPIEDKPLRLLFAMTLGWKTGLTNEVYTPFMQSGTMHIFAISGLHIALIAALLVAVLRVIRIPRHWCAFVVIPLIWFYTGATGWQSSAIRSVVMMSVIIGGWALRRPSDLLNSLATAALIILIWQPVQLFQAGFQLSFFVVLSIALFTPHIQRRLDRLLEHDPMLPRDILPRWRRWLHSPLRWLLLSLATSLAAWLGSLPLTVHYFHLFSPVTLLANLFIVPLSSAALACNLGSLMCGDWLPWLGELFNHSAWFWMSLMVRISHLAITLPGAYCYVPSPPAWIFVAYYALLTGTLGGWLLKRENRRWAMVASLLLGAGIAWEWSRARNEWVITAIPLNGGHAIHLDAPGKRQDWLVDCGDSNAVEFVTIPFLHAQGVNTLQHLVLTHGDIRHVGGTRPLWSGVPTARTLTSAMRFRSPTYREVTKVLESEPSRAGKLVSGETNDCWIVLHPHPEDSFPRADDGSLVLLGSFNNLRILLLGDLGRPGQETLMRRRQDLRANIVVTGLPEQGEPLCDGLIEAIRPQLIVVADSRYPATKRAPKELRNRLGHHRMRVVYLGTDGALTIKFRSSGEFTITLGGDL